MNTPLETVATPLPLDELAATLTQFFAGYTPPSHVVEGWKYKPTDPDRRARLRHMLENRAQGILPEALTSPRRQSYPRDIVQATLDALDCGWEPPRADPGELRRVCEDVLMAHSLLDQCALFEQSIPAAG